MGRRPSILSTNKMQIPCMGPQQGEDQDQNSSPKQQKKRHQQLCKQQQKQSLNGGPLPQRSE